jgi:hypothetical protein
MRSRVGIMRYAAFPITNFTVLDSPGSNYCDFILLLIFVHTHDVGLPNLIGIPLHCHVMPYFSLGALALTSMLSFLRLLIFSISVE